MPDEPSNNPTNPSNTPGDNIPQNPTPDNKGSENKPSADDSAYKLGKVEAELQQYKDYLGQIAPVIQTIQQDPEVFKTVNEALSKRIGGKPTDVPPKEGDKGKEAPAAPPAPDPVAIDTRNGLILQTLSGFMDKEGITKLPAEEKSKIQKMIGDQLVDMADVGGVGKPLPQVINEIPLAKLPSYLEKSWRLVKSQLQEDKDPVLGSFGNANSIGAFGSVGGGGDSGQNPEDVTLTDKEKQIAANMGIAEDKYLQSKKDILKRQASEQL